jgi:diaminopropionate ammonia-lyase
MQLRSRLIAALRAPVATPLVTAPSLAKRLNVAHLLIKLESARPLGNFKVLGGLPAGLKALARAGGTSVDQLLDGGTPRRLLPTLFCASDGNHGLAVAAAALVAGAQATIVVHKRVDKARIERIVRMNAEVVIVDGTYDDAVEHAGLLARDRAGLLIPDTTDRLDDPIVNDVMAGYGRIADEIADQLTSEECPQPTHLFVQAGVGGLAATMASRLAGIMKSPGRTIVVEPVSAACVGHALETDCIERIAGDLETAAGMLSCGIASAPAIEMLRRNGATAEAVSETELGAAVELLEREASIRTTASGACGLAGLLKAAGEQQLRRELELSASASPMIIVTEGRSPEITPPA